MTRRGNGVARAGGPQEQAGCARDRLADLPVNGSGVPSERADAEARATEPGFVSGQTAGSGEVARGEGWELRRGDCLPGLRSLPDCSVDSIVTDPPAGISFMGKEWDSDKGGRDGWVAWLASVMAECLRVLKPGGHALVWALPRTSHWTATAVENAGFEIRDVHHHIFGTGFPKSLNVSSVMHELLGVTDGEYGTALKPAVEHWILARKPLEGTYAENIRAHGVGALNVGACRVGNEERQNPERRAIGGFYDIGTENIGAPKATRDCTGRWPAHLSLDEYAAAMLDEMSGVSASSAATGVQRHGRSGGIMGDVGVIRDGRPEGHSDCGGASRFFYVAKGSRAEKDRGLELLPRRSGGEATGRVDGSAGTRNPRAGAGRNGGARNIHPTVKSIELMRWLVRLVTPMPGSLVLDPFAGSGTTGLGCLAEGMQFLGFELGEDYFGIARARLDAGTRQQVLPVLSMRPAEKREERQVDLFASGEVG